MIAQTLRKVEPIDLPGVVPGGADETELRFEMVDPCSLMIDDAYQRSLSPRSLRLIGKIVANWNWKRFKPPIVADTPEGRHVIDGQHTCIAAACHPRIDTIPVMLISVAEAKERAGAFVGHNRDRVAMTPVDIYYADAAAGDELALTVQQVCARAGVRVLRYPPGKGQEYKPGDTQAITALKYACDNYGAMQARLILETLVKARVVPIKQVHLQAIDRLLFSSEFENQIDLETIGALLRESNEELEREARAFAATYRATLAKSLASVLFKHRTKGRSLAKKFYGVAA